MARQFRALTLPMLGPPTHPDVNRFSIGAQPRAHRRCDRRSRSDARALEPARPLRCDAGRLLHRDADPCDRPLVEQPADQRDPVRHPPWPARTSAAGAPGPAPSRSAPSSPPRTQSVSVSDGCPVKFEIVSISSRSDGTSSRSTSPITRAISAATRLPQPVRLHEVHRREEPRHPEQVRPGVRHLHLQLVVPVAQRQLLERGRRLGEEHGHQAAVRPVGEAHLHRLEAELTQRLQRRPVHVGRRRLRHPLGEVADLQA